MLRNILKPFAGFVFCAGCVAAVPVHAVELPQDHAYQVELRDYMARLTEADFTVEIEPLQWEADAGWIEDVQELHRMWLLTRTGNRPMHHPDIVTTLAEYYTLESIETPDGIRMSSGFVAPEPGAWLADWEHPINPYHADEGLINRVLVVCAVDMMMLDQAHEQGKARRSDYLGGTMVWLSYAYHKVGHHWPREVREAYETGLRRMVGKMTEWGPKAVNDNMDMKSVVSMHYIAQSAESPELRRMAERYARLLMERVHPSGMIRDAGGLEASYHGIATFFMAWAAVASDWDFVDETFDRMSEIKAYLTLPHEDRYVSPTHFSTRTSAGIDHDQWSYVQREIAATMASDHALYLAFGGRTDRDRDYMIRGTESMLNRVQTHLTREAPEPSDKAPKKWGERHWPYRGINYAADHYPDGFYERIKTALEEDAPESYPPFEREGATFVRNFADTFLVARYADFGVILYTGPIGFHRYMNYAGGSMSAFWTPEMGAVLLGHAAGDHRAAPWSEWRTWPTHALSGVTGEGKAFSSARIRRRVMDVEYTMDRNGAEVVVSGPIGAKHDGGRSTQDKGIQGEDVRYERRFTVAPEGLIIETSWKSDGTDAIAELYESLPVFLGNERKDQAPSIYYRVQNKWQEAGDTPVANVNAIGVKKGEDSTVIELEGAREVRLSPEVFQDDYMTQNRLRNVQISLLEPGQTSAEPVRSASVRYRIRPHDFVVE